MAAADWPILGRAKLFQNGSSQAVRLPKQFRFEGTEVFVRRMGNDVVLSRLPRASMQNLIEALDEFERDFMLERSQPLESDFRATLLPTKER